MQEEGVRVCASRFRMVFILVRVEDSLFAALWSDCWVTNLVPSDTCG